MAPRKRAGSGSKKSGHLNREPLQPSQPSKFGIQHFFERHSQSQKTLSQNSSKRNDDRLGNPSSDSAAATNKNPQTVTEPIINPKPGNDLDHGTENPGGMANLGKIESMSKYLRGENPRNNAVKATIDASDGVSQNAECRNDGPVANSVDVNCGSSVKGFNDGVVDLKNMTKGGNLLKVEASSPSQDTPTDTLLPTVVDDEENQLEVSPEASKSVSVKRFKFSPGMVIVVTPCNWLV